MRRRNVLFITVDQWRGDCLSRIGHPVVKTPHLDAFAETAVQFAQHYTNAVPCGPSRACLHTGMYVLNHRSGTNGTPLDARFSNWALEARRLGYAPALFGYTHTARDPREFAADHPYMRTDEGPLPGMDPVLPMGTDAARWRDWLAEQGYTDLPEDAQWTYLQRDESPHWAERGLPKPLRFAAEHSDTRFMVDSLIDWIAAQRGAGEAAGTAPAIAEPGSAPGGGAPRGDAPGWMAHLSLVRPHPPWIAPEPYNALYDPASLPGYVRAQDPAAEGAQHPWLDWFLKGRRNAASGDLQRHRLLQASYYGLMNEVDDNLARLWDAMQRSGDWDDTLIVLTSDHGEQMGDHWMLGKAGWFDQSWRVPCWVRDPDAAADGARGTLVEAFTEHVDLMPTILDWIGAPIPRQCDGRSLLPIVRSGEVPGDWRDAVHMEYDFRDPVEGRAERHFGLHMDACSLHVRRTREWKYVHFTALPPLLFHLASDPGELQDRAGDPACAQVLSEQARALLSHRMRHADKTLTHYRITPETGLVRSSA